MLRRLIQSRATWRSASSISSAFKHNISTRNAFKRVVFKRVVEPVPPVPPVLARSPDLYKDQSMGENVARSSAKSLYSIVYWWLKMGAAIFLSVHIFNDYFYAIHNTWGISMVPTIRPDGDSVIVSKYYRHGRGVKVGDIVSFLHPFDHDIRASKRVIGMPGDFVMRDSPDKGRGMMVQVPEGHCWVVGDNLTWSRDSRMYGALPLGLVRGKIVAIIRGWDFLHVEPVHSPFRDADERDYYDV